MARTDVSRGDHFGTSFSTNGFTPPNNSLLVMFAVGLVADSAPNAGAGFTITDSAGLTWTRKFFQEQTGFYMTRLVVWTAPVITGQSMTVTVNSNEASTNTMAHELFAFTDYDSADVYVANKLLNQGDGAWSITLPSEPRAQDEVIAVLTATIASSGDVRADPGAGWTEIRDSGLSGYHALQVQSRIGSTSTTVAWADVLGVGSNDTRFNSSGTDNGIGAAIIIKRASGVRLANLTSWGETTTNPMTSASITVPKNTAIIVSWTGSQTAPNQDSDAAITAAPAGLTFTQLARVANGRRCTYVWIATNTTAADITGTIQITQQPTGGGTANGHMAIFDNAQGINTSTPNDTVQTVAGSGTDVTTPDVGTPDTGDAVWGVGTSQLSGDTISLESSFTTLARIANGTNVRQMQSGFDVSAPLDETFTVNLGGSTAGSAVAFILNALGGGGGGGAAAVRALAQYRQRRAA